METRIHEKTVVVSVRRPKTFDQLGPNTKSVHTNGFPFLWLIKQILEQAPRVQTIQVTPCMEEQLGSKHRQVCDARRVRLTTGYVQPGVAAAWKRKKETRKPDWRLLRDAMLALTPKQQKRFNELITLGFEEAQLLSRYFCLNGEKYVSQRVIARKFKYSPGSTHLVSTKIRAVMHYLIPEFKVGKKAAYIALSIEQKVIQAHERLAQARREKLRVERRKALARQLGLEKLPENLPLKRLETFKLLIVALRDGRLHIPSRAPPKALSNDRLEVRT